MEFSTEISAKEFKQFRYSLWQDNKKRNIIHRIAQVVILGIILIPFIQIMLLGISHHVSFWKICKTYPRFFVSKGWATEPFFVWLLLFFLTYPRIIYLTSGQKKYEQFLKNLKTKKMVFSDVRVCGYNKDNTLIMAMPYISIKKIIWLDDFAAIITSTNNCYPLSLKEMNESQQEEFIHFVESMKNTTIELTKELTYSIDDVVWQQDIQLTEQQIEQFTKMYQSANKKNAWKILMLAGICEVLFFLDILRIFSIALMIAFLIYGLRFLLPKNQKRIVEKTIKQMPEYIDFLSGTTVLTPKGMYRYQKCYYNFYQWSQMTHTIIGAAGVLVMQNNKTTGMIPRNLFEDDIQFLHYAHWIEQQIQQAKSAANPVPLARKR